MVVNYRYPFLKEYIVLLITDVEMLDIAFTVVTLPGNNLELFIDARVENPSYLSSHSAFRDSSYST